MRSLEVSGYTYAAIKDALHARKGAREVSFRYELLGRGGIFKRRLEVREGEISMDAGAEIKRTGRFIMRDDASIDWQVDKIKPWFLLRMPDGGIAEWPLGVFFLSTAPRRGRIGQYYREVEAYDLSQILVEDCVTERYFIRRNTPYTGAARTVVSGAGIKQFAADDNADILRFDREWELGTPKIQIVNDLLEAINYNDIFVNADGVFTAKRYINPSERPVDYTYSAATNDISIVNGENGENILDTFSLPNVFVGVVSSPDLPEPMTYIHEIDNPASPVSAINREGRRVVKVLQYDDIASPLVLMAAVTRAAFEAMQVYEVTRFTTAVMPHHEIGDLLALEHSAASGRYIETAWSMPLRADAAMTHNARKVVYL